MDEWVSLADSSGRNIPWLWIGPKAAGHHVTKSPTQIGNEGNDNAAALLWHYTIETMNEARNRDLDALGMYNLTLQANSWANDDDGRSIYGQRVAMVQAMMVCTNYVLCSCSVSILPSYPRTRSGSLSGRNLVSSKIS